MDNMIFTIYNHSILLEKLTHHGFSGAVNEWFSWYLTGRTQTTHVGMAYQKSR